MILFQNSSYNLHMRDISYPLPLRKWRSGWFNHHKQRLVISLDRLNRGSLPLKPFYTRLKTGRDVMLTFIIGNNGRRLSASLPCASFKSTGMRERTASYEEKLRDGASVYEVRDGCADEEGS